MNFRANTEVLRPKAGSVEQRAVTHLFSVVAGGAMFTTMGGLAQSEHSSAIHVFDNGRRCSDPADRWTPFRTSPLQFQEKPGEIYRSMALVGRNRRAALALRQPALEQHKVIAPRPPPSKGYMHRFLIGMLP